MPHRERVEPAPEPDDGLTSTTIKEILPVKTIADSMNAATPEQLRRALTPLLEGATSPAFGALTKRELELLILECLVRVGYLSSSPSVYELIQSLKVSRSRARGLLYDRDLRCQTPDKLDAQAREALSRPLLQGQGYAVALDIDNPVLADYLREKLRQLGHTSDGSFSPSLVRLSDEAAAALMEALVREADRPKVLDALHKAGVPDKTLKGAIRAVLSKAASNVADKTGEVIAGDVVDYFGPILTAKTSAIRSAVLSLFKRTGSEQG